jgi:predicted transcriptional regulator
MCLCQAFGKKLRKWRETWQVIRKDVLCARYIFIFSSVLLPLRKEQGILFLSKIEK